MSRDQRTRIKNGSMIRTHNVVLAHEEVIALLSRLCIQLGFCLSPNRQASLACAPPEDVDEFTRAVFVAEGLDPVTAEKQLYNQVRQLVAHAFVQHNERQDTFDNDGG
jgi:hypothetical protein